MFEKCLLPAAQILYTQPAGFFSKKIVQFTFGTMPPSYVIYRLLGAGKATSRAISFPPGDGFLFPFLADVFSAAILLRGSIVVACLSVSCWSRLSQHY